jgi:DNA-binding NarL/FixJ family response regulator
MMRPRILLADDHRLMLEGLQRLLQGHTQVVGAVEDGRSVVQSAIQLRPDLVLLDISMPGMNGLEAARALKSAVPDCKIIFLTMHADPLYAAEAFEAGGSGYVLKRSAATELVQAIRVVMQGKPYATPAVIKDLLRPFADRSIRPEAADQVSPMQLETLHLMALGRSAMEIAEELQISVEAAVGQISNIIQMLDLQHPK